MTLARRIVEKLLRHLKMYPKVREGLEKTDYTEYKELVDGLVETAEKEIEAG